MLNSFVNLMTLLFSINPLVSCNKEAFFSLHKNISQKYPVSFSVDSPFKDDYGTYNLTDDGHSINDYIENLEIDLSYTNKSLLIKAPYLLYTSSENRYYQERTVDTIEGTTVTATRSGTMSMITHSGTTSSVIRSGTTAAISLCITAFNTWKFQVVAQIIPMYRMPKYSTERMAVTRQICYKYRSKRMQTTANLQD